ncbi:superoxide dismutase family protein [Sporosarcina sp. 179-K 3D1 HS]|uniref:superoxide dismutase family protein n=1 Tax=Sporosarcina sp. 179-K 3D1 HS TaxID=3232169 RepID=UPI0039A0EA62
MKRWFWLVAAFILLIVLAACGNESETPEAEGVELETELEDVETPVEDNSAEDPEASETGPVEEDSETGAAVNEVEVDLLDTDGQSVGTATLTEEENGVKVKVVAENLTPGEHGFHFHETGVCEAPDFESAGGHFNPDGKSHGLEHEEGPHAGDLPNLEVGEDGTVETEVLAEHVTLASGEPHSLLKEGGTALVIHAEADDGKTQPSGDSGDRIVCGVIEQ